MHGAGTIGECDPANDESRRRRAHAAAGSRCRARVMHRHPIAVHWGRADLASSNMISLETTRTVWQARADSRRRTASVGIYAHLRDRWGIFYDQPILLSERQAGPAIEGVIRQESTEDVAQLASDSHVFTNFAMALAQALGFDLCPGLSHLRDRRLHVPVGHTVPEELLSVTDLRRVQGVPDERGCKLTQRIGACDGVTWCCSRYKCR
ncbi:Tn3 family transposase [Paraburkholderia guartelaensis]|uniref:Tn3 family transposase n=1 Tax=Paraburkholderia guartelaensis TaxID=2546446 RepID=UPI003CCC4ED8